FHQGLFAAISNRTLSLRENRTKKSDHPHSGPQPPRRKIGFPSERLAWEESRSRRFGEWLRWHRRPRLNPAPRGKTASGELVRPLLVDKPHPLAGYLLT